MWSFKFSAGSRPRRARLQQKARRIGQVGRLARGRGASEVEGGKNSVHAFVGAEPAMGYTQEGGCPPPPDPHVTSWGRRLGDRASFLVIRGRPSVGGAGNTLVLAEAVERAAFGADITWEVAAVAAAAAAKSVSLKYEAGFTLKFVLPHLHVTILQPVTKGGRRVSRQCFTSPLRMS